MKLSDIYSYLIANFLNSGAFAKPGRLEATSIDTQYNSIFTKSSVKQIYRIMGIKPDNMDTAFIDYLKDKMFELNPNVEMDLVVYNTPIRMSVTDDKFSRNFTKSAEAYSTYKEVFDSQQGIARLTGKTYKLPGGGRVRLSKERLLDLYQVYISYKYLFDYLSSGGTCSLTSIFIEFIGQDLRDVKRAGDDLYGLLSSLDMGCQVVKSATKSYYLQFGPAVGSPVTGLNKRFLPQMLFTDENSAAWSTYKSRGLVGGGKGALLFGMDFRSRLPFSVDLFKSGGAENFLLIGKTGSGKTYAAFQIALSALALNIHVSAIDIKGREWSKLSKYADTKIISFDSGHSNFVNTLRLDDLEVDSSNSVELFETAVRATVQLFILIVNLQEDEGNRVDAELVLREAVLKIFANSRVDPLNPITFKDTAILRYSMVLPILESLSVTATYTEGQKKITKLLRSRLYSYFGESGMFAEMFRNEITLSDILDTQLVIFEFNKNQNAADNMDIIRTFMIQHLVSKKQTYRKNNNQYLVSFFEELQRCENFGNLLEYICSETTGARSNNAIIFLLMNSLKVLQGKSGQDIRSNITSIISSTCEDNDIVSLRDEFGREWLAHQLELFADKPQQYRNCFAAHIDNGVSVLETVYKVEVPDEISRQFRTRTIVED